MRRSDEIKWKDRSWRLLENNGQKAVDDCSIVATAVDALFGVRKIVIHKALAQRS
jgi:hypothetical protein